MSPVSPAGIVHVVRPGLQTTVQDAGRWGWQAMGVSVSGAMDRVSYRVANILAANVAGAAALEIGFTGPELEFDDERTIAVAGAAFDVTVNGQPVPVRSSISVPAGGRVRFGARHAGARAYLAVAGGLDVPTVLGSRSTHVPSRLGGLEGRALMAGDRLPLGTAPALRTPQPEPDQRLLNPARMEHVLRVLPGRHAHCFVATALDTLQSAPFVVGNQSNRMGFRLEGGHLQHRETADIQSEIMSMGSLQVPASGQPILLMADRQTTGGYTVVANVITADLPIAGQLAPGDLVTFRQCTKQDAHSALVAQERALAALEQGIIS